MMNLSANMDLKNLITKVLRINPEAIPRDSSTPGGKSISAKNSHMDDNQNPGGDE